MPVLLTADDESLSLSSQLEVALGDAGTFAQMQSDPDRQRLLGERPLSDPLADIMLREIQHQER